ncbi:MAG: class I SAM-dependent methyltransferase [bacterium]|nr:class I SAM-dependent methyltransferase [bacterium]
MIFLCVLVLDAIINGHALPTSGRARGHLVRAIQQYTPNAKTFYDLGCAHGSLSLKIKKIMPALDVHAIDNSALRIFVAMLKTKFLRRGVHFHKQDLFHFDLRNADVVYSYLWYDHMLPLEKKLLAELKPGAMLVTNTSRLPYWQPDYKIITFSGTTITPDFETLFVYLKK